MARSSCHGAWLALWLDYGFRCRAAVIGEGTLMIYRFGDFELREEDFSLIHNGSRVALEPKTLLVLLHLVKHAGHLVEKSSLLDTVWANTFVEENTLARAITVLRHELGDSPRDPKFIQTIPTRGYRFIAAVEAQAALSSSVPPVADTFMQPATTASTSSNPQPIRRWLPEMVAIAVLFVLIATAFMFFWPWHRTNAVVRPALISIAVLPIQNRTGEPSLDYVSDGMTQNTIQALAGISGLRVIGSTTAFHFRDTTQDAQSIGHTLGVNAVLVGRLQRNQDRLVLNMELNQTSDNTILLSHQYLSDLANLRDVQADLLHDTLQALSFDTARLGGQSPLRPHTDNPGAYEENLRGEALIRTDSHQAFREAIGHFQNATQMDSQFDRAWSDLAAAHLFLGIYYESPLDHMPIARRAAQRALELNPSLPEAHGSLGVIDLLYDWDSASAASELEKEGALRSAMSLLACSVHLREQAGQARSAEEEVRRLLSYDPQSEMLISELGCAAYYEHHFDDAVRSYRSAIELAPSSPLPYLGLGRSLTELGHDQEAVEVLDSFAKRNGFAPPILLAESGYTCAVSGHPDAAMQRMHALEKQAKSMYVDPYLFALIYHGLHDHDQTIFWLKKAAAVHSALLFSVLSDPMWQNAQADPQFMAIVETMKSKSN
ncbi:winged helix-turn-helix domain-containing protein [Edaphobacter albus]|uniref:winged helix-turn-helix domain-containing protein n=1 Tax=Edaphobacter sp. 4G125 TaxID=2763071 RepID=UPI0016461213|nr:winged helix-turn-helix domain-containing protein [Edaphobacter sp. 4G125]QNI37196.1 winged helix-turn-helix domain-containing protein [Edaphobacter sp. 4G125]